MRLALFGLALAAAASLARGGRFERVASAQVPWVPAVMMGLVLQVVVTVTGSPPVSAATASLLVLSQAGVLSFCLRNWYRSGIGLIALGFGLNAAVILANGAMPVAAGAITSLGGDPTAPVTGLYQPATATTALPWLADRIPVPPLRLIVSIGDVLLVIGLVPFVHEMMSPPTRSARLGRRL